ncbi:Mannosyltransferase (PIG-V) [Nakaseomyces glabratus]
MHSLVKPVLFFVVVRIVQYAIISLSPNKQFDLSTNLLLAKYCSEQETQQFWHRHLFNKLLSWDSVFFIKTAMTMDGYPEYEHEWAFSVIWSSLIRSVSPSNNFYTVLKTAVILENLIYFMAMITLFYLTRITFGKLDKSKTHLSDKLATFTAILFSCNSGSGFFTGPYSEPLSFLFSFLGILAREFSVTPIIPYGLEFKSSKIFYYTIVSSFCFTIATLNRSNCILLGFYYVFDSIYLIRRQKYKKALLFPVLAGCIVALFFVRQQFYIPYKNFCELRGEWCNESLINFKPLHFLTRKTLYSYIQSEHWNLGLFNYWTPNNIPNFLFGLPTFVILFSSTFYFSRVYPNYKLKPLIFITRAFTIIILLFAHVQIINRISTFIPLHLWYISDRFVKFEANKKMTGDDWIVKGYIYWLIFWVPIQTSLFAFFLPPA